MTGTNQLTYPVSKRTSRRQWLRGSSAVLGSWMLTSAGCVPTGKNAAPELVWGRRGFSDGRFLKPRAVTIDASDQLYIVDTTGRIQVFDDEGNLARLWMTPKTKWGRPTGLAIRRASSAGGQDHLLVADTHYYRMLVYQLDGTLLENAQIGGTAGHSPGEFAFVTDAVCDRHGCYYIGEYGDSDRIQKFDPDGKFITQWGGTGRKVGQFVRPQSLVIDGDTLWIADAGNHRIQRFDIQPDTPRLIDSWGSEGIGPGKFYYPYDLALASDGSVTVCEFGNHRLQRLSASGTPLAIWGGPGFEPGQLYDPWGLVIDSQDRIHVLDSKNQRVQRLSLPT